MTERIKAQMLTIVDKSSPWYAHSAVIIGMENKRYNVNVLEVNDEILAQESFRPDQVITALEYRKLSASLARGPVSFPNGMKKN
jgi:hypothetical protein